MEELENFQINENPAFNRKEMFLKFWEAVKKENSDKLIRERFFNVAVKIAAALIIGLFIGIYITSIVNKEEPVYYTAHSPMGSVSEWKLPDGTVIFLNADTEIKYKAGSSNEPREVYLDGEGWFNVGKDKKRPFIVHTPYYDVHVTGTQFNIKAYRGDNEVITTIEEGEVELKSFDDMITEKFITLIPGEQAIFNKKSKNVDIKTVNSKWYTAWKENKLIFMNMSLKELIVLIERKYGVDIIVKDESILDYHCDGTFKNESIIEVLEIIKKTLPINYHIVGQQIEITSN
ncbi:MAG: FecR family protein [Prolixibacteraceae bacterium]|nr:FecR family protein [Prolixibacteraceae bacterium]